MYCKITNIFNNALLPTRPRAPSVMESETSIENLTQIGTTVKYLFLKFVYNIQLVY